jgi:tryptophan halogenase
MDLEFERIRDFLILHYVATERDDSEFWNHIRSIDVPDTLAEKLDLFRIRGRVVRYDHGLFLPPSWIAVMLGQGIIPEQHDARVNAMHDTDIATHMQRMRTLMKNTAERMTDHRDYLHMNGMVGENA